MEEELTPEKKKEARRTYAVNDRIFLRILAPIGLAALAYFLYRDINHTPPNSESLITKPQIERTDQETPIVKLLNSGEITYSSPTKFSFELTDSNGLVVATVHADKVAGTVTINPSPSYVANGSVLRFDIADNPEFNDSKEFLYNPDLGQKTFGLNKNNVYEIWVSPVTMERKSAS